jgi:hypothetical protein
VALDIRVSFAASLTDRRSVLDVFDCENGRTINVLKNNVWQRLQQKHKNSNTEREEVRTEIKIVFAHVLQ